MSGVAVGKEYFTGLTSLRAIAALGVLIGHVEQIRLNLHLQNNLHLAFYKGISGHLSVLLFFVLSGFLITFLLLKEAKEKKGINIRNFYLRRALRIYPIYYLMVVLCFTFALLWGDYFNSSQSSSNILKGLLWFLLIAPNIRKVIGGSPDQYGIVRVTGTEHLWSIGAENQFYIIWPYLLRLMKKYIIYTLFLLFLFFTFFYRLYYYLYFNFFYVTLPVEIHNLIVYIIHGSMMNAMVMGSIGAWLYLEKKNLLSFFSGRVVELILILCIFPLWFLGIELGDFSDGIYSVLFSLLIINMVINDSNFFWIKNRVWNFLGRISYGIYIYHWIVIFIWLKVLNKLGCAENFIIDNIYIYAGSIGMTILVAFFSYTYLESWFLKLNARVFCRKK